VLATVSEPTFTVSVDVAEPPDGGVTRVGDKVQFEPVGQPERVKFTVELKPFSEVTVKVELPELRCWIVRELGDADKEKSGAVDPTATLRALEALILPQP
jgi:hypothetical protein